MPIVGAVDSLWRYPVKSMRGEELAEAFVGFSGLYGDRLFAFKKSDGPAGFPYLTGRDLPAMLLYRPRFRDPGKAAEPANLTDAANLGAGATPLYADPADLAVDVETPAGEFYAINDPALARGLGAEIGDTHAITLLRSERALTDCRPISLFSLQTAKQLGDELGLDLDKRRFRANVYLDLAVVTGFQEDAYIGKTLRLGAKVEVAILERDPRCKMITLDPDTAEPNPDVLRNVVREHETTAGIYAAVLVEGTVRTGDDIKLLS